MWKNFNKNCLCVYNFIATDDVTTLEHSEIIWEEFEVANNDVELTNKPETSKILHEIDEEDDFEFEGLKPELMM